MKFFFVLSLLLVLQADAAQVDTLSIYSASMKTSRKCIVIKPFIPQHRPLPYHTLYLLHGFSGDYSNWLTKMPELREYADQYNLLIVCPDGAYSSWYLDSPVDPSMKYETYISKEVTAFIDSAYVTIRDKKARAITGLSMGGHGALYIGLRHPDIFGACGSMSGAMDLLKSKDKYDLVKRLGDTTRNKGNWKAASIIQLVEKYAGTKQAMIIDCGIDDSFIPENRELHQKLMKLKIAHDYIERPGGHNWDYWTNSLRYQLLFFQDYFSRRGG